ncbi:hypothetical protein F5Y13DRAFT_115429 [Hypoxylon sp. FL1857]|nr:hypothetical protein F5Y13DRAFT_115429 [Hypoxylon sp. FL1857]
MSSSKAGTTMAPVHGETLTAMVVGGVFVALAIVSVGLRFYTRIFMRAGLWYDDWLILLGVATTLVGMALLLRGNVIDPNAIQVTEDADPSYVYSPADVLYFKYSFAVGILYFTVTSITKTGILFMYYRIFGPSVTFRYQLFAIGSLVVCWWIISTIVGTTNCLPMEMNFEISFVDPRFCRDFNLFWLAVGACEVIIDTLILILPVGAVLRMHLSRRQKLTVSGIFLLGSLVIITGIVKVVLGYNPNGRTPFFGQTEIWGAIHVCIATLSACLPILKPLITRITRSSLVTKTSTLLSIRRQTETRESDHWFIVDGRDSASRSGIGNGYGGNTSMELSSSLPGLLQQPDGVYLARPPEWFGSWQMKGQGNGEPQSMWRPQIETAESSMTAQLADYLERGTEGSDTDLGSDSKVDLAKRT